MSDQSKLGIGEKITTPQEKDAIHIAVAPVIVGEKCEPGDHVGFLDNNTVGESKKPFGIIDPFLPRGVKPGEKCWVFLYPGSIVSLRHDWTHPAFREAAERSEKQAKATNIEKSEKWLREFISTADCPDYDTVIDAAINGTKTFDSDYMHFSGQDAHGEIPAEFWYHIEVIAGKPITKRPQYFSCGC